MTQMGMILGTAAYMSPEQAKGHPADKRSDIWSFGAVLHEMLSGRRTFKGDDIADTLAAVLRQDVDWTALPASTPSSVRYLVARCLERDVKKRLRDIGEARIVLDQPAGLVVQNPADSPSVSPPLPLWRLAITFVVGSMVGALAVGAAWYAQTFAGATPDSIPVHAARRANVPDGGRLRPLRGDVPGRHSDGLRGHASRRRQDPTQSRRAGHSCISDRCRSSRRNR